MRREKPFEPGKFYHVYNRGNNRENIFIEPRNYSYFLKLYAKHMLPVADLFAYCLMRNHFHLLIRTKDEEELKRSGRVPTSWAERPERLDPVTRGFASMFQAYSQAINKAYARTGRLFQEHFGRIEVDSDQYFATLVFYIHFNPQKHGFVSDFRAWEWSSYPAMMSAAPTNLRREETLAWFDGRAGFVVFHAGAVDERAIAPLVPEDFE